ncbi:uncharacterized protein LOC122024979 [Zingiber officinale]|uniref:Uncharacterized protein n=1 Tax=Zingiber officinale TaxID=94328 RepID=A0A8J5EYL9_ZINOF|nr:uncharacterized protein LOC122024979 [Zingiber officinale]KAG6475926.1 hypothetical protein ZIOFF_065156 [Zingiber officinale]KAG6478738.1 hypothetical protein ZIOFF_062182 [Zingiber officinale]
MDTESPPHSSSIVRCMASPSWFPHGRSRFYHHHLLPRDENGEAVLDQSRGWRGLLKKLLRESKGIRCCCNPKPLSFGYDADSYSKNFDDGRSSSMDHSNDISHL